MFEPYQLQSDMEEYGFYVTMDTADTSIHIYDAYEGYAKEDSYRIPAGEGHPYISQPYQDGDGMVVAYGTPITYGGRVVGVVITSVDPVSYTHLDVYKRQAHGPVRPGPAGRTIRLRDLGPSQRQAPAAAGL